MAILFEDAMFANPEDITEIVLHSFVICVGQTVMTERFIARLSALLVDYECPVYAFSICLDDTTLARYAISLFDAVVVQSPKDAEFAATLIGHQYVHCIPDVTTLMSNRPLHMNHNSHTGEAFGTLVSMRRIGICPGSSVNADFKTALVTAIVELKNRGFMVSMVPFSPNELVICRDIAHSCSDIDVLEIASPLEMIEYMKCFNLIISTHFHPLSFASMIGRPAVSLACPRGDSLVDVFSVQTMVNRRLRSTFDTDELVDMVPVAIESRSKAKYRRSSWSSGSLSLLGELARYQAAIESFKPRLKDPHPSALSRGMI